MLFVVSDINLMFVYFFSSTRAQSFIEWIHSYASFPNEHMLTCLGAHPDTIRFGPADLFPKSCRSKFRIQSNRS